MSRGGAEVWLMRVLRRIDRTRFKFIFLTLYPKPGEFDEEIRSLGGDVIPVGCDSRRLGFGRAFLDRLRELRPAVVHSHMNLRTGQLVKLAYQAGVPVRIAHSHITMDGKAPTLRRRAYQWLMRRGIDHYCTHGIGCSSEAADFLFRDWRRRPNYCVLPCGIETADFGHPSDRNAVCAELGIPPERKIIGHVGRFMRQKNHEFALRVLRALVDAGHNVQLLLVGDGPLRAEVEALTQSLGLGARVTFAGLRTDVGRLLETVFDLFLLPSLYEGLPVVAIEAQCAGVPVLLADTISREVAAVPELIHWQSLSATAEQWAAQAVEIMAQPPVDPAQTRQRVIDSPFSIVSSVSLLTRIYASETSQH